MSVDAEIREEELRLLRISLDATKDIMSFDNQLLAQELAKKLEWKPGMLALRWAPGHSDHLKLEIRVQNSDTAELARSWGCVPALADEATAGCLLSMATASTKHWEITYDLFRPTEKMFALTIMRQDHHFVSVLAETMGEVAAKALLTP